MRPRYGALAGPSFFSSVSNFGNSVINLLEFDGILREDPMVDIPEMAISVDVL